MATVELIPQILWFEVTNHLYVVLTRFTHHTGRIAPAPDELQFEKAHIEIVFFFLISWKKHTLYSTPPIRNVFLKRVIAEKTWGKNGGCGGVVGATRGLKKKSDHQIQNGWGGRSVWEQPQKEAFCHYVSLFNCSTGGQSVIRSSALRQTDSSPRLRATARRAAPTGVGVVYQSNNRSNGLLFNCASQPLARSTHKGNYLARSLPRGIRLKPGR